MKTMQRWILFLCLLIAHLFIFFASPVYAAIAILDAFTTAGPEACDPCTADFTISAGSNRQGRNAWQW